MRTLLVAVLTLLVCQAPQPTIVNGYGFACKTPDVWLKYNEALAKNNGTEIRMVRLAQRCVDLQPGEVNVLEREGDFLLIESKASRKLYIPKGYIIE